MGARHSTTTIVSIAAAYVTLLSIYAYDAYMISCARIHSAPLITIDNGLKSAAEAAGVTTLEVLP